jgi:hypothetical protein
MRQPEAVRYPVIISIVACRACVSAAVPKDLGPVRWPGRRAVVALPEHLDVPNTGQIGEALLPVISGDGRARPVEQGPPREAAT